MGSNNYTIAVSDYNYGGGNRVSGQYRIADCLGGAITGDVQSSNYNLSGGLIQTLLPENGQLASVTITSATSTVEILGSQSFTAQALDQYGFSIAGATYTWTLKTAGIGTLDTAIEQTVVFTATRTGTVDLQVIAGFGTRTATATAMITVVHGQPVSLTLTPATCTLTADGSQTYTARAEDSAGNRWDEADISWSITDAGWNPAPQAGTMSGNIYYPGRAGTWTITGMTTNGKAGTATVVVRPGAFVNLNITAPSTVTTNATFTLTVTLSDSKGNPYSGTVAITNTTQSISPAAITLTSGTGTAAVSISRSPSGGTDTIAVRYSNITATVAVVVFVNRQDGGTVTDKGAEVVIGTMTANVTVHIATSTSISQSLPGGIEFAGTVYEIDLRDEQGNKVGTEAGQVGTTTRISLEYPDTDNDGWVDRTDIREKDLKIYQWGNGTWTELPTAVNEAANIASACIPHFSTFILAGTTTTRFTPNNNSVIVYPNPYTGGGTIWFDKVSQGAVIRIYNIAGELVKEITVVNCPQGWNILNESIASGIYIYTVTGGNGGRSAGKIGVVR